MSDRTGDNARLRHIPFTVPYGQASFGDHYIRQDDSMAVAAQFDVTVYPRGNNRLPMGDPMRGVPHVETRVFDGTEWTVTGRAPICRTGDDR